MTVVSFPQRLRLVEWQTLVGRFKPEWYTSPDEDMQFYHFKSREDFATPAGKKILDDCSMYRLITADDPPIYMTCTGSDTEPKNRNHLLHHPRHMQVIKKRCDEVGVEAHAISGAGEGAEKGAAQGDLIDFLLRNLGVVRAGS